MFEVRLLRPFGQMVSACTPRLAKLASSAFPNGPSRSFCDSARSVGKMYGMSSTEITGLNPPRNAAGMTVPSMAPNCVLSIIWRALPSCDDG